MVMNYKSYIGATVKTLICNISVTDDRTIEQFSAKKGTWVTLSGGYISNICYSERVYVFLAIHHVNYKSSLQ